MEHLFAIFAFSPVLAALIQFALFMLILANPWSWAVFFGLWVLIVIVIYTGVLVLSDGDIF